MDKLAWCNRCEDEFIRCENTDNGREIICTISGQVLSRICIAIEDCAERETREPKVIEPFYNIYSGEENR